MIGGCCLLQDQMLLPCTKAKIFFTGQKVGLALDESDLKVGMTGMNPGESPFVMRHPLSGKWIIFMNGGYSVSDDPISFPPIKPYHV